MVGQVPKQLKPEMVERAGRIVSMGADVEREKCTAKYVPSDAWMIADPTGQTFGEVRRVRDEIRHSIERDGYDRRRGVFVRAYGSKAMFQGRGVESRRVAAKARQLGLHREVTSLRTPYRRAVHDHFVHPEIQRDLRALREVLGLDSAADALDIVARYVPTRLLTPRVQYLVEELFDDDQR